MAPVPFFGAESQEVAPDKHPDIVQVYDVIIVGAGFSGISALYRLRKQGLTAHIFETASDFGGVWFWNRYPGARVDSETPFYQLNIPEVYNTWSFKKRFPDHVELREYMAHVDKTLNLRRDTSFNSRVNDCTWDDDDAKWTVKTESGVTARAQFFVLATGLLHRPYLPSWPDQEKYQGSIYHSVDWPEHTDVKGKRVAVIGAGSTSVQIVQELGKTASHLTLLQRRPPYCLPMHQKTWTPQQHGEWRSNYPALFAASRNSAVGIPSKRHELRVQDVSPAEREQHYSEIWQAGGHQFLLRNYNNVMLDKEANKAVYDFWRKKVQLRLTDPRKQALMTPDEMPYYFSTKRTPLEHDFYEVLNQKNVDVVDITKYPIQRFTEGGLRLSGEAQDQNFDYIICATGFDSYTGSMTNMGLKNSNGVDVKDVWGTGVRTYLGLTMHGFPNVFMVYSPHAPNALANAPTIIECQCDVILDTMTAMRAANLTSMEATRDAEDEWKSNMDAAVRHTLYPLTNSWWNTGNVPGKKVENQLYILGIKKYEEDCREKLAGWKGFDVR